MNNLTHEIGKLELVERLENETLEKQCQRLLEKRYGKYPLEEYDSYIEAFEDGFYEEYIIIKNNIYHVIKQEKENFQIIDNLDNTYDFDIEYDYTKMDFNEAIRKALKNKSYKAEFKPKATIESLHIEPEDIVIIEYDNSKLKQKELADLCSLVNDSVDNMVIALPLPCRAITKTKTQLSYIADKLKEIAEEM